MEVTDYIFQGNEGEKVPTSVEKLIVNQGVQVLPDRFCENCVSLREVTLPKGLIHIGSFAFSFCQSLLEIEIGSTVESMGTVGTFEGCQLLRKVEFGLPSSSSAHPLKKIPPHAFQTCRSLQRIKVPSSVDMIGEFAFECCAALVEVNLSTTSITEIPCWGFSRCVSLLTVSLPISLGLIDEYGFNLCMRLVTVAVPLEYNPIVIEHEAFSRCSVLANIVVPKGSSATEYSFLECLLLQDRFGEEADDIVAGLVDRFDKFPVHGICYDHSTTTAQELRRCIENNQDSQENEVESSSGFIDQFGMSPFHVLFSTVGPSQDVLEVLLKHFPYQILDAKDANGKQPLDYLVSNWTETTASLLQITIQRWMVDPLVRWGATSWAQVMSNRIQAILAEDNKDQRLTLCNGAYSAFTLYEHLEATSIFEMALWKRQFKGGWSIDGTKRQALDRGECRCACGSNVVIPNVVEFLL